MKVITPAYAWIRKNSEGPETEFVSIETVEILPMFSTKLKEKHEEKYPESIKKYPFVRLVKINLVEIE